MGRFDVAIVGAGPSGSSAAIALLRRGYSVLLVDKSVFPRSKLCGDFLNPINWPLLEWLGAADPILALEHEVVTAFRITSFSGHEATFGFPLKGGRRPFGLGLSRYYLDHLLLRLAEREGATVMQGWRVSDLRHEDHGWSMRLCNRLGERIFHSSFLVGADGRNSWVAHRLGLTNHHRGCERFLGFQIRLRGVKGLAGQIQIHIFPGGYAGLVGVGQGLANLCFTVDRRTAREQGSPRAIIENHLYRNPRLKEALRGSPIVSDARSAYPIYSPPRRSFGRRFVLVGDSACVTEPASGEGIYFALQSGRLAAETIHGAFARNDFTESSLANYGKARRGHLTSRRRVNQIIRSLIYRPSLLHPMIRLSSRISLPIGPLVNFVVGTEARPFFTCHDGVGEHTFYLRP